MPFYMEDPDFGKETNNDGETEVITEQVDPTTQKGSESGGSGMPMWLIALISGVVIFIVVLAIYFKWKTWKSIRPPRKEEEPTK